MSEITRGDTTLFTIPLEDANGAPYNLTGCSVWVTIKTDVDAPDVEALYQHVLTVDEFGVSTLSEGLTLGPGGAEAGIVIQELTPQESALFDIGSYVYDVQVMTADGRIYTPINGVAETVIPDLTLAIDRPV